MVKTLKDRNRLPIHTMMICGIRYEVVEVLDLKSEDGEKRYYGKISHLYPVISIEEDMALEIKIQTAIHESLHGLLHQTGHYDIEEEERLVQMLGCQLPRFLRENRELVDLIMQDKAQ